MSVKHPSHHPFVPNRAAIAIIFVMSTGNLIGSWRLISVSSRNRDGSIDSPYGPAPTGVLTYTDDGRMSALISFDGRKPFPFGGGSKDDQVEAFRTFLGYAGTFTLTGNKVIHRVEVASIQNLVGKDLIRTVKFDGDRIVLTTPPTPIQGSTQIVDLTWQRI
jgi:lipocalin-like protein